MAFPSLSGQQESFSSVLCERLSTVVIDCSRQFCKTLYNVLLSSQLSFECSVLIRQSAHLLLQCSQRIFHLWMSRSSTTLSRVGSHARAKGSRVFTLTADPRDVRSKQEQSQPPTSRVPHSFRDSQLSVAITRGQATHVLRCQSNTNKERTMIAVYLLCVLCATLFLTPANGLSKT